MEIAFQSLEIRSICENEIEAYQHTTQDAAVALKHRLADLRAATSIKDLLVGSPREISVEGEQHYIIDLLSGYFLCVAPNHPKNPLDQSGKIDWNRVSRIKVVRIEEHDQYTSI